MQIEKKKKNSEKIHASPTVMGEVYIFILIAD